MYCRLKQACRSNRNKQSTKHVYNVSPNIVRRPIKTRCFGVIAETKSYKHKNNSYDKQTDADIIKLTAAVAKYTKYLVIVGVVGAVISFGMLCAIKRLLDAMEAGQRPWIGAPEIPIKEADHEASLTLIYANVGHLPATGSYVDANFIYDEKGDWGREGDILCQNGRNFAIYNAREFGLWGVFPGNKLNVKRVLALGIAPNNGPISFRTADPKKPIPAFIVGCIVYSWEGEPRLHSTGFLGRIIRDNISGKLSVDDIYAIHPD